ncbi:MAG: hypothetical protein ACREBE_03425, partial [bacterium]
LSPVGVYITGVAVAAIFAVALVAALRGAAAAFAAAWIPAILLLLAVQHGVVNVRVARLEGTPLQQLPVPERQRLVDTARSHPWFVELFRLASDGADD